MQACLCDLEESRLLLPCGRLLDFQECAVGVTYIMRSSIGGKGGYNVLHRELQSLRKKPKKVAENII
jgi:hypothetical protein